jgi:hypothetical protein
MQDLALPSTPAPTGRFEVVGDVFCGDGYAGMQGRLAVA